MPIRIDFHCHTSVSKDSLTSPERLVAFARRRGLDRLVVTDHNAIAGGVAACRLAPDLVIVGEEIRTSAGEILAAFVHEVVPPGLTPRATIRRLREQGSFISVSHPFDIRSGAWCTEALLEIVPLVDAIEVFNARCMKLDANRLAQAFAREHGLPGTAGSDAHAAFELGAAVSVLPDFSGPDGLRSVIREATVRGGRSPTWVHFASQYARLVKTLRQAPADQRR